MQKETLSTSPTNQKPKIELPDKTLVGVKPSEPKEPKKLEKEQIPQPTGWRMIVLPFRMDEKTAGGVLVTETTLERQQVASQCGLVLAMGPQC